VITETHPKFTCPKCQRPLRLEIESRTLHEASYQIDPETGVLTEDMNRREFDDHEEVAEIYCEYCGLIDESFGNTDLQIDWGYVFPTDGQARIDYWLTKDWQYDGHDWEKEGDS